MTDQTENQPKTQGITTEHNNNKEQKRTEDKEILSPKAGALSVLSYTPTH